MQTGSGPNFRYCTVLYDWRTALYSHTMTIKIDFALHSALRASVAYMKSQNRIEFSSLLMAIFCVRCKPTYSTLRKCTGRAQNCS
jgi:hypothetical protein